MPMWNMYLQVATCFQQMSMTPCFPIYSSLKLSGMVLVNTRPIITFIWGLIIKTTLILLSLLIRNFHRDPLIWSISTTKFSIFCYTYTPYKGVSVKKILNGLWWYNPSSTWIVVVISLLYDIKMGFRIDKKNMCILTLKQFFFVFFLDFHISLFLLI